MSFHDKLFLFVNGATEAQRGKESWPGSQSWLVEVVEFHLKSVQNSCSSGSHPPLVAFVYPVRSSLSCYCVREALTSWKQFGISPQGLRSTSLVQYLASPLGFLLSCRYPATFDSPSFSIFPSSFLLKVLNGFCIPKYIHWSLGI